MGESGSQGEMAINLDFSNMMAENIGANGIKPEELYALSERAVAIHADIAGRRNRGSLPFLDLPKQSTADITGYAEGVRGRFNNLVVVGIGGSALGPMALQAALGHPFHNLLPRDSRPGPRIFFMDNVDPDQFKGMLDVISPRETLFNVVTKSGSTAETMANFLIVRKLLEDAVGRDNVKTHLVVTTDPAQGDLKKIADREGLKTFIIDPGVGGRFSVFTPVGLLPAAIAGLDIDLLLAGAAAMEQRCSTPELMKNPAYLLASLQYLFATKKGYNIAVMMPYASTLQYVADWFSQLWGESLGKKFSLTGQTVHTGQTPVKAVGTIDQHSQLQLYMEGPVDKTITFIRVERFGETVDIPSLYTELKGTSYLGGHSLNELINFEQRATEVALSKAGRPNCRIDLPEITPHTVGQLIFMLELQTAFSGGLYNVNPYDQPGVEEGKNLTYGLMGRPGYEAKKAEVEQWGTGKWRV